MTINWEGIFQVWSIMASIAITIGGAMFAVMLLILVVVFIVRLLEKIFGL